MRLTLSKADGGADSSLLNNKLLVNYNGLIFSSDSKNSARISFADGTQKDISLLDWRKDDELSCSFHFSDDITLSFAVSDPTTDATLSVMADFPEEVETLFLPYSYSSTMQVAESEFDSILFSDKKDPWEFVAYNLEDNLVSFTHFSDSARYRIYIETQRFSFENLVGTAFADKDLYESTIAAFKANLMNSFKSESANSKYTEQNIVAYVAAMAEDGKYTQALGEIPQNFRRDSARTYLSAPYFDSLSELNRKLEAELRDKETLISRTAASPSLELLTLPNLAFYLTISQNTADVTRLLDFILDADIEASSIAEITGILRVYVELSALKPEYAATIRPILDRCIDMITDACSFENNILTISENDTFLSVVQGVETGSALLRYGNLIGDETLAAAGYVLVNSYMAGSASFDLRTLSYLYPILAYDNWYYPHFVLLQESPAQMWAWTCAKEITVERNSTGNSVTYTIDFPENYTHYMIIKGVPAFDSIYIYDMAFRSDRNFESYNSSGYVYNADSYTLLLKSRHKQQLETVRLALPRQRAAAPAPRPAPASRPAVTEQPKPAEPAPVAEPEPAPEPEPVPEPVVLYSVVIDVSTNNRGRNLINEVLSANNAATITSNNVSNHFVKGNLTSEEADALVGRLNTAGATAKKQVMN